MVVMLRLVVLTVDHASAASDLVGRQLRYGKHEVFTMTHCGEGRGIGLRPPNQMAPLYAGVPAGPCLRSSQSAEQQLAEDAFRPVAAEGRWQP